MEVWNYRVVFVDMEKHITVANTNSINGHQYPTQYTSDCVLAYNFEMNLPIIYSSIKGAKYKQCNKLTRC